MTESTTNEQQRKIVEKLDVPGAGFDRWWLLVALVVGMILLLTLTSPDPYGRMVSFMADGIWVTIKITSVSFILVIVLGLIGGLGRLSRNRLIKGIAHTETSILLASYR